MVSDTHRHCTTKNGWQLSEIFYVYIMLHLPLWKLRNHKQIDGSIIIQANWSAIQAIQSAF